MGLFLLFDVIHSSVLFLFIYLYSYFNIFDFFYTRRTQKWMKVSDVMPKSIRRFAHYEKSLSKINCQSNWFEKPMNPVRFQWKPYYGERRCFEMVQLFSLFFIATTLMLSPKYPNDTAIFVGGAVNNFVVVFHIIE